MSAYNNQRNLPSAAPAAGGDTQLTSGNIFNSKTAFELAFQMANTFAHSTIVPREYQNNAANCLIALNMATRIGTDPMMVMQNLYVIQGRPSWSSQFIIAMINRSGKYKTELQYELSGAGDTLSCCAYAFDLMDRKVTGPPVTMQMARAEGWLERNGSKWKTMPETMIRYRAAAFFGRLNCPELVMGIYSEDEVIEISASDYKVARPPDTAVREPVKPPMESVFTVTAQPVGQQSVPENAKQGNQEYAKQPENNRLPRNNISPESGRPPENISVQDGSSHPENIRAPAGGNVPTGGSPQMNGHPQTNLNPQTNVNHQPNGHTKTNATQQAGGDTPVCADCGKQITGAEVGYSNSKYGRPLCRSCQNTARAAQ